VPHAKRTGIAGAVAILVFASGNALLVTSTVEAKEAPSASTAIIAAVAPDVIELAEPSRVTAMPDGAVLSLPSGSVRTPQDAKDGVTITVGDITASVVLPAADSAVQSGTPDAGITYRNGDESTTVVLANSDDSVTFVSILDSPRAPSRYSYGYRDVGTLKQADDGGVTIWRGQEMVGYFLEPWAIDAAGTSVPTHYEVSGGTLTQVVDHTTDSFEYPIVADPTQDFGGNSLYSNVTLNIDMATAKNVVSVTPAPNINWGRMPRSTGLPAYDALVPSSYEGAKFHDQLVCHWANAVYFKTPWNLDSWRPDVGYAATAAALCNPT
jgi:hypothetical protein